MNVHDAVAFVETHGPELISVIERLKAVESVVAPLIPSPIGAAIDTGVTIAEDVVEGVDVLAAKIDEIFGPGTAAKLRTPAPAPKPAPVAVTQKPTPAQIIAAQAARAVKG